MTGFDDQLRDELRRRFDSVELPGDWARSHLLPEVVTGIDTRPHRVPSSRAAAFASLAASLIIVLVLVVAMPRLGQGPGPSAPPQASLLATGAPPSQLDVLSAAEFVTSYQAGDLHGRMVLVDARIDRQAGGAGTVTSGPSCDTVRGLPPLDPLSTGCVIGTFVGHDPQVVVRATYVQVPGPDPLSSDRDTEWHWIPLAEAPVEGRLVLSVEPFGSLGTVYLKGIVDAERTDPISASDAASLDIDAVGQADVLTVDGWLGGQRDGAPCPEPPPADDWLPVRGCPLPYWLADDAAGIQGRLDVQLGILRENVGAATNVFDRPEVYARRATYLVAKRLKNCDSGPCWQLEVTGVVPGPVQIPVPAAPTEPRTIACVSSSDPEEPAPSGPTVIDETGYIAFCGARTTTETAHEGIVVSNPIDLQWTLDVSWSGTPCDLASTFTFSPAGDHFELVAQRPDRSCDEPLVQHQIELFAYGPMPAHMVSASFSSTPAPAP